MVPQSEYADINNSLGGNGTALGIKGAVVPGEGPNSKTEVQTTVFWSKSLNTDYDLGYTEGGVAGNGNNKVDYVSFAMAQSGNTLPQVSSGGSVSGTYHVVTDDGCGPLEAVIDPTGTSLFSKGVSAKVTSDVPGTAGECPTSLDSGVDNKLKAKLRRALVKMGVLSKRAKNVNKSYVSPCPLTLTQANHGRLTILNNRTTLLRSPLERLALVPSAACPASALSRCPTTTPMVRSAESWSSRCPTRLLSARLLSPHKSRKGELSWGRHRGLATGES